MDRMVELVFATLTGTSLGIVIIGVMAKAWVEKRIELSIGHEYSKKLADYQSQITQRELELQEQQEIRHRAALIADLLSHWVTNQGVDRDRLNKLSFEAFLWLPQDIAEDLSNTLAHQSGAPSIKDILVKVRRHLLGPTDTLPAGDVIYFDATVGTTNQQRSSRNAVDASGVRGG